MPSISNHKHKIVEKSTKSSQSSSRVVSLGPADLWGFPTLQSLYTREGVACQIVPWCLCGSMSQWHSWFPRAMLIIFGWYRWAGTKWVKEPFMTCPNIAPSVNDPVDFYIYATHWKCLTVNIAMTSCRNLAPGVNAVLGCSYLLCPIVSHIWRIRRAFQKRLWNLKSKSSQIFTCE